MTVEFAPQSILTALWKATTKPGYHFPYGLRAKYERYDIARTNTKPTFDPYEFELYRISRFVEEEGGSESDVLLGRIVRGAYRKNGWYPEDKGITFSPSSTLTISDAATVIMDCRKAGIDVHIDQNTDLSKMINTAALLVES